MSEVSGTNTANTANTASTVNTANTANTANTVNTVSNVSVETGVDEVEGYVTPSQKSLSEIVNTDQDDSSLQQYKKSLLGEDASTGEATVVFPDDPRRVIVKELALVTEDRPDKVIDLTESLDEIKKNRFVLKEGIQFKIRINYIVQRDIVSGLKYIQRTSRMGVTVDKMAHMLGSYAPKQEEYSYTTPTEDAPAGITGRGSYHVHSLFTDDDNIEHLKWEWYIEIKKDWDD